MLLCDVLLCKCVELRHFIMCIRHVILSWFCKGLWFIERILDLTKAFDEVPEKRVWICVKCSLYQSLFWLAKLLGNVGLVDVQFIHQPRTSHERKSNYALSQINICKKDEYHAHINQRRNQEMAKGYLELNLCTVLRRSVNLCSHFF